jgi:hypothetical protein
LSAVTGVKVLSSEIVYVALGQGFCLLETNIRTCDKSKGEYVSDVPGSEATAGRRIVYIGTWENRNTDSSGFQGAEEATRRQAVSVVGLTHSRGVGRVMPAESEKQRTLEGVSSLTQRGEV